MKRWWIPLWLGDFINHQGYGKHSIRHEQDNQHCITLLTKGRSQDKSKWMPWRLLTLPLPLPLLPLPPLLVETIRFIEIRKFWISDYIRIEAIDIASVPTEDMTWPPTTLRSLFKVLSLLSLWKGSEATNLFNWLTVELFFTIFISNNSCLISLT